MKLILALWVSWCIAVLDKHDLRKQYKGGKDKEFEINQVINIVLYMLLTLPPSCSATFNFIAESCWVLRLTGVPSSHALSISYRPTHHHEQQETENWG